MSDNFRGFLEQKAGLSEEQFIEVTTHLRTATFKAGEMLLRQGDVCDHTFFVEQGLLRLYSISDNGKEHILQFAPENWFISDRSSAYFGEPSEYFIDAIEDTTVVFLDKEFLRKVSDASPSFRSSNDYLLHNHIRFLYKRVNMLISDTAEQRYLSFIELYPDLTLRVPQWMIASYLGITPESLSRVRKELARRNFRKD